MSDKTNLPQDVVIQRNVKLALITHTKPFSNKKPQLTSEFIKKWCHYYNSFTLGSFDSGRTCGKPQFINITHQAPLHRQHNKTRLQRLLHFSVNK